MNVLIRGVSSFWGSKCSQLHVVMVFGDRAGACLSRCPYFRVSCQEGLHCMYVCVWPALGWCGSDILT